jgi:hypothetical protein
MAIHPLKNLHKAHPLKYEQNDSHEWVETQRRFNYVCKKCGLQGYIQAWDPDREITSSIGCNESLTEQVVNG